MIVRPVSVLGAHLFLMRRRTYSYIRANRRRWGLSQAELALLLGLSGAQAVSHIELAKRAPNARAIIGCTLIFGMPAPELLPTFHRDVEDGIVVAAQALIATLGDCADRRSQLVRSLLDDLLARLISSDHTNTV